MYGEIMFSLKEKDSGKPVLMKSGTPFTYSSRELAKIGKRLLESERKTGLLVVENR